MVSADALPLHAPAELREKLDVRGGALPPGGGLVGRRCFLRASMYPEEDGWDCCDHEGTAGWNAWVVEYRLRGGTRHWGVLADADDTDERRRHSILLLSLADLVKVLILFSNEDRALIKGDRRTRKLVGENRQDSIGESTRRGEAAASSSPAAMPSSAPQGAKRKPQSQAAGRQSKRRTIADSMQRRAGSKNAQVLAAAATSEHHGALRDRRGTVQLQAPTDVTVYESPAKKVASTVDARRHWEWQRSGRIVRPSAKKIARVCHTLC